MELAFSKHSMERIKSRGVSKDICMKIIETGNFEIRKSEMSGKMRCLYSNNHYKVVTDLPQTTIITVMNKKQKFVGNKVFDNYAKKLIRTRSSNSTDSSGSSGSWKCYK